MRRFNGLHAAIWRWHFLAGMITAPIIFVLGITGAIYLFKPIAEPLMYAELWTVQADGKHRLASEYLAAATAVAEGRPTSMTIHHDPNRTVEVTTRGKHGTTELFYLHPDDASLVGNLHKEEMLMQKVHSLHGELWAGTFGAAIVEIVAGWVLVLTFTGWYLWWPRGKSKVWGVWLPRLRQGGRVFWRDLHAVTAMWASGLVVVLILTGLPWTNVFGSILSRFQTASGQSTPAAANRRPVLRSSEADGRKPLSVDVAIEMAQQHGWQHSAPGSSFTIVLPRGPRGTYAMIDRDGALEDSRYMHIDQYGGELIAKSTWSDFPTLAKAKSLGIRLHQGELWGWPNFVVMLFATLALPLAAASAIVMWWKRRPIGGWGVPRRKPAWQVPRPVVIFTCILALALPMLAASLVVAWVVDWVGARFGPTESIAAS